MAYSNWVIEESLMEGLFTKCVCGLETAHASNTGTLLLHRGLMGRGAVTGTWSCSCLQTLPERCCDVWRRDDAGSKLEAIHISRSSLLLSTVRSPH